MGPPFYQLPASWGLMLSGIKLWVPFRGEDFKHLVQFWSLLLPRILGVRWTSPYPGSGWALRLCLCLCDHWYEMGGPFRGIKTDAVCVHLTFCALDPGSLGRHFQQTLSRPQDCSEGQGHLALYRLHLQV